MYELQSRVRYSELDADARLSIVGIMNYLQDCSTLQSEDCGVGLDWLEKEKRAWLLSSWQIQIRERPKLGEHITVATWPYEIKGIYAMRNFVILNEQREYLVQANSCWFLYDTEVGRPVRIMRSDVEKYGAEEPRLEMDYAPRRILLPDNMTEAGRLTILRHQIDTNHHVNNAQYVDIAREVIPADIKIRQIRAEYKKAAVLGDEVVLKAAATAGGYVVSLCSEDGSIFANIELAD